MPPALRDPDPVLVTGATGHVGARARGASRPRARPGVPREAQLGGPDVLSHRAMIERAAGVLGRRPPAIIKVPVLTPRLSSYWVTLVTPVEAGLARPLVDGWRTETVVTQPPPPGTNDHPLPFEAAVREALG
jgi:hypothetical protein